MGGSNKVMAWVMLVLNLVLIVLVATNTMLAMWLMALIMLIDALMGLALVYRDNS